jgi:ABC-type bacteriocin/lantibiotic exporter with double-glycine peptidase domain
MHKIQSLKILFNLSKQYHNRLCGYFVISLLSRLVVPLSALVISYVINQNNNYLLAFLSPVGAFLAVRLTGWFLNFMSRYMWFHLMTQLASDIVKKSFSYLLHLDLKQILQKKPQEWSSIIDINSEVRNLVSYMFNHILPIFFEIALTLIFLYKLNMPIQTILVAVTAILYIGISVGLSSKISQTTRKLIQANIQKNIKSTQFIHSIFLTKTYGAEKNIEHNFNDTVDIECHNTLNNYKVTVFIDNILTFVLAISMSLLFYISYVGLQKHTITLGAFAALMSMATSIFSQLTSIDYAFRASIEGLEKLHPMLNIIQQNHLQPLVYNPPNIHTIDSLSIENLCANHYDCETSVLNNINYTFYNKKPVFLVGKSGSGKTTLLKSLLNICESSGTATINNHNIPLSDIKNYCAWVDQENQFVGATVAEDFNLFCPNANEQDMINALKHAQIWDLIESKGGLHAQINNVFSSVSGGQKQRLSIARALCSNKPILLLDEPTSALDLMTEQEILNILMNLDKIIIITMHRLKSIPVKGNIIVMQNGTITQEGLAQNIDLSHLGIDDDN